mgnify:CR=1 FL=1
MSEALRILVVDDEEDIRDLISGILTDEGYETRSAGDSETALAAVNSLDEDRIVRHFVNAVQSAIRTNYYQLDKSGQPGATQNHLVLLAETLEGYHNLIKIGRAHV